MSDIKYTKTEDRGWIELTFDELPDLAITWDKDADYFCIDTPLGHEGAIVSKDKSDMFVQAVLLAHSIIKENP